MWASNMVICPQRCRHVEGFAGKMDAKDIDALAEDARHFVAKVQRLASAPQPRLVSFWIGLFVQAAKTRND